MPVPKYLYRHNGQMKRNQFHTFCLAWAPAGPRPENKLRFCCHDRTSIGGICCLNIHRGYRSPVITLIGAIGPRRRLKKSNHQQGPNGKRTELTQKIKTEPGTMWLSVPLVWPGQSVAPSSFWSFKLLLSSASCGDAPPATLPLA